MSHTPEIVVLGGGTSAEREVSLASSLAVFASLDRRHAAQWIDLKDNALPPGLDPARQVVFPVLHGTFGEDGGVQRLLEAAGFAYVGCDARASELCMDKRRSKDRALAAGLATAPAYYFSADRAPELSQVEDALATLRVVVKPLREGSSVGLHFADSGAELQQVFAGIRGGEWMIEPRLDGYDVTVGVLNGEALGVVEILTKDGGAYDFARKYTAGMTDYRYPASFSEAVTAELRSQAARVFAACGCRDFARIDFFNAERGFVFLEINTIPGLTATSLLPKSAQCIGLDFDALTDAMIAPAVARFYTLYS